MLMSAHNGAVEHRVFVVGIGRKMLKYPLPHTGFGATAVASVDVLPVTEMLWQIAPGDAGSTTVEYGFDEQTVILGRHPDPTLPTR